MGAERLGEKDTAPHILLSSKACPSSLAKQPNNNIRILLTIIVEELFHFHGEGWAGFFETSLVSSSLLINMKQL